ncbi:MAG: HD domain-containing phosphohydrolase, partial [Micromonosporaceae bacterium]
GGLPSGLAGEAIGRPARLAELATQAVIFYRLGGTDAALTTLRQRAGGWLDPELVAAFTPGLLRELDHVDVWDAVLDAEPKPYREIDSGGLDRVAETFADFVDLKSPYFFGHSTGVAELAEAAGHRLGFAPDDCRALRHAGLFHDLGRVAVPTGVWEKPRPLGRGDWEKVRLHPYHSERILSHSTALAPLAKLAGAHHERRDGSGYPSGAKQLSPSAYVLAAADAYQAMTQPRPHRPARSADLAATTLLSLVRDGAVDPDAADAVLAAAGHRPSRRTGAGRTGARPAGLSEREIEVLRLVACGRSNPEVAATLRISPRTAEHHVQHIYTKIGVSTRAAAAVYALRHGLVGSQQ